MPYGYIVTENGGRESNPYQALMDTGSSLILVVMDAAEDLLNKSREEIISKREHEEKLAGLGGDGIGYGWRTTLRLKSAQKDAGGMLIPEAIIYAVDCPKIAGYSALFGQKTGFEQRWFKQHNHSSARYWQLRERK
jgi:hypothetical protein